MTGYIVHNSRGRARCCNPKHDCYAPIEMAGSYWQRRFVDKYMLIIKDTFRFSLLAWGKRVGRWRRVLLAAEQWLSIQPTHYDQFVPKMNWSVTKMLGRVTLEQLAKRRRGRHFFIPLNAFPSKAATKICTRKYKNKQLQLNIWKTKEKTLP